MKFPIKSNEEVFKIHLSFNQWLQKVGTDKNIEYEWRNIRGCLEEAVEEEIVKRKRYGVEGGLRLWNDEVTKAIEYKNMGISHVPITKYRWN